jgi:hypothetical protein
MVHFIETLKQRNEPLFYFGAACFLLAVVFLLLTSFTTTQVYNVNAWHKPFKFALSIAVYSWTMAWYCAYLSRFNVWLFDWSIIALLGFEIIYIAVQAGRGQLSHYNLSTPLYSFLYTMMALAATSATLYTAYIGYLFFTDDFPGLPVPYLWAIRLSIVVFVLFSFVGFLMGSRLTHSIGGADGGAGLPILNWSTRFGDPRIAHFIGMHALQVLPFLSYYLLKTTKATIGFSFLYALLALFTLIQAMQGKPLFKTINKIQHETIR